MLLECINVKKYFSVKQGFSSEVQKVKAVDGVDFSIRRGENVGLVGESGSGKSTMAKLIMKLMPLTDGILTFEDKDVVTCKGSVLKNYRKNVQMVFQDPYSSLDPRFIIRDILKEAMLMDKKTFKTKNIKNEKAESLMVAVGLKAEMLDRYPHEFSGGERQRIAIARALVNSPKLLILDEAVSSLDVLIQEQIIELLKELQSTFDVTYVFISHNLKVIRKLCTQIAVMYKGKIVEKASDTQIFETPKHRYTKKLLHAALEYGVSAGDEDIILEEGSDLVHQGQGHFLLEKLRS